jgi:hypothetical protein
VIYDLGRLDAILIGNPLSKIGNRNRKSQIFSAARAGLFHFPGAYERARRAQKMKKPEREFRLFL